MKTLSIIFLCLICFSSVAQKTDTQRNLHTLFTTSHTRNQLDQQRQQGKFYNKQGKSSAAIIRKPIFIKMQGVVIRKNKNNVVFINNKNNLKSSKIDTGITVNAKTIKTPAYKVPIRVKHHTISLKPGQQWDESSKTIREKYQIKSVKVETNTREKNPPKALNSIKGIP